MKKKTSECYKKEARCHKDKGNYTQRILNKNP